MLDPRGVEHFAVAFAFTQVIEIPLYLRWARLRPGAAFGASLITHPIVWFALPALWASLYLAGVYPLVGELDRTSYALGYGAIAETFAILVEALYLRCLGAPRPFRTALLVNAISAAIGTATHVLTGWP